VTEIPEHLLKRSRDRRAGGSGDATPAASGASTPAVPAASAPAKAAAKPEPAPKVAKPDSPVVAAAKARRKIPFWAMATLSLLPVWGFLYVLAIKPTEKTVEGPIAKGIEVWGGCAGCHGAAGQGGAGRVLYQGEALKTFPHIEDMRSRRPASRSTATPTARAERTHPCHTTVTPCPSRVKSTAVA
jgi:hypothetical protein